MMKWTVEKEESGLKLLKFLHSKANSYSLKQLKRFLEENLCQINGVTERFATALVFKGDVITFKAPLEISKKKDNASSFLKTNILYEDEELFIYNKPSGITSDGFKTDLKLIHRLDKETTGVLMFAKTNAMLNAMIELFRKRLVKKEYLAIVDGCPKSEMGVIDNYLGKKHTFEGQAIWGAVSKETGLHAITEWKILKKAKKFAVLKCFPKTGRTHQIRVHLSEMKHPILGDHQYGKHFKCQIQVNRCLLHAQKVLFIHPSKKIKMEIEAIMPPDFLLVLNEAS